MKAWRIFVVLFSCFCSCTAFAQKSLWRGFDNSYGRILPNHPLNRDNKDALKVPLGPRRKKDMPDCSDSASWRHVHFQSERIPVSSQHVTLVRGGCPNSDFSNETAGSWLILWHGNHPQIISDPIELYPWFHRVQPHMSRGFHDFTMFGHISSDTTGYAWYRFDGHTYRRIDVACAYKLYTWNSPELQDLRGKNWDDRLGCVPIPYSYPAP